MVVAGCGQEQPSRIAKSISMSGPQALREDNHPNDYRWWGNRRYFKDSHTGWVKFWVSWYDLQQGHPATSRAESWADLRRSPQLRRLDAEIAAADDDGVHAILTIYQAFPTWANGATGPDPLSSKGPERKLPANLGVDSPWGWFVAHLSERYQGNVDAIEIVNEPNTLYWPLGRVVDATATMMRSAAEISARWGRQAIIAPATSDTPDPAAAEPGVSMDWRTFTSRLLDELGDWRPPVPVHWSQHNYNDVRRGTSAEASRAKQTIGMLERSRWQGDAQLWLTEGGYNLGRAWRDPVARQLQAARIDQNFHAMRALPGIAMWTQHGINDVGGNNFKSALRDDFGSGRPGGTRPVWSTWLRL